MIENGGHVTIITIGSSRLFIIFLRIKSEVDND